MIQPGECFGEMAYLGAPGMLRTADVIAASDLRMLRIPVAALERMTEITRLNFDRAFLRVLVERLIAANSRLAGV